MYVVRGGGNGTGGFGSAAQFAYAQAAYQMAPVASSWPQLIAVRGAPPSPISAYARVGGGGDGFGGITSYPVNYTPQVSWVEGQSHKGYPVNIPLRLISSPSEDCPIDQQMFVCGGLLKWENAATIPPAGIPSGLLLTAWNGAAASVVTNPFSGAAAAARCVGVIRRPTVGDLVLGFANGLTVSYAPLTHPGGDVRIPVWVEFVLRNARLGRAARLTVYLNNVNVYDGAFGGPELFGTYNSAAETGLIMTTFAEAFQRVWCGQQYYRWGPDAAATR